MRKAVLSRRLDSRRRRDRNPVIGAVSVGFFFLLIGIMLLSIPDAVTNTESFLNDLITARVPNLNQVVLPAPAHPAAHQGFYALVAEFSLAWGVFQVFILLLKIVFRSTIRSIAETVSGIITWLGTYYLVTTFLIVGTLTTWFAFWALVLTLWGISMLARAIVLAIYRNSGYI